MSVRSFLKATLHKFGLYEHPSFITAAIAGLPSGWRDPKAVWKYAQTCRQYLALVNRELVEDILLYPSLGEATPTTPMDLTYFYQDTWAAKQVFRFQPQKVVDIGSTGLLVGIISQFCRTISVDIRPLTVSLPGLECRRGSLLDLPFPDASFEFITSMCVLEHVGLGRYGDPVDPHAIFKAAAELVRVLAPGGILVASVMAGPPCVAFNAHRVITREEFLRLFPGFKLEEEIFIRDAILPGDPSENYKTGDHYVYGACMRKP